jgi:predicted flap endonuclease-1-like 5' DNA nuclease
MMYLLSHYWLWMLLALILGGIVGFTSFLRTNSGSLSASWPGWFKLLSLAFIVGVVVAFLKLLPGTIGHYLETALLFVGSYIVGCFAGSWLASLRAPEVEATAPSQRFTSATPVPVAPVPAQAPVRVPAPAVAPVVAAVAAAAPAAPAPVVPTPAAAPQPLVANDGHPGLRPKTEAKGAAKPDNLKRVAGIGHVNEEKLNELGIWYFRQIASWTDENAEWVGSYLAFPGRIEREHWVSQATKLAQGLDTEFSRKVDRGEVPTSL